MVANGYIVEHLESTYVYQDNIESFAEMLAQINLDIGPTTSRHSDEKIYIQVAPGDKNQNFTDEVFNEVCQIDTSGIKPASQSCYF